ncbi:MAG TPA: Gfo/Idh/MocA family oxidoreductase, partial [Opitutaceae bacterium]|nr:Gfo/Idh/MocA family oxidoreductase [Opitutaceae bacterium]
MPLPTTTRRRFLQTSAAAAAALSLPRLAFTQNTPAAVSKIQVACIGIGHRGWYAVSELLKLPMVQIVAVCDVDETLVADTRKKASELGYPDFAQVPLFKDYREMFAKMGDRIDAVTVSTPDHHHYPATMMALQRRKHVYVEKPLTHTVGEARALRLEAKKAGVITQMGNQGRATEGIRLMREWTQAGVLGDVRNVVAWSPEFPELYYRRPTS